MAWPLYEDVKFGIARHACVFGPGLRLDDSLQFVSCLIFRSSSILNYKSFLGESNYLKFDQDYRENYKIYNIK